MKDLEYFLTVLKNKELDKIGEAVARLYPPEDYTVEEVIEGLRAYKNEIEECVNDSFENFIIDAGLKGTAAKLRKDGFSEEDIVEYEEKLKNLQEMLEKTGLDVDVESLMSSLMND